MLIQTVWVKDEDDEISLLSAWDEYTIDSNPEGWEEEVSDTKKEYGDVRVIPISVRISDIRDAFNTKTVKGRVNASA